MFDRRSTVQVKNSLQLAIEDLLERVQGLRVNRTCFVCGSEPAFFFLIPDYGLFSEKLICCRQAACRQELLASRSGQLHAVKDFLLLISSRNINKQDAKTIVRIFKKTHEKSLSEDFS